MCLCVDSSGHFLVVSVCIIPKDVCEMMVCLCIIFLVGLVGFGVIMSLFCFSLVLSVCWPRNVWCVGGKVLGYIGFRCADFRFFMSFMKVGDMKRIFGMCLLIFFLTILFIVKHVPFLFFF